jgi:hypothetical protein
MLSNIINGAQHMVSAAMAASANMIGNGGSNDAPKTKRVETVIFHDLLRVNIPSHINYEFPAESLPSSVISYDTLAGLLATHRPDYDSSRWNDATSRHAELIGLALSNYDKVVQEILRADILDLTYYYQYNLEDWDITQLCLKYDVAPVDIFVALVADASPFGMGAFAFPATRNHGLADKARADFTDRIIQDSMRFLFPESYIHYDYWNGIGVKTSFPKDINKNSMRVNIRRYNDRNDDQGYYRIIKLFAGRVSANLDAQQQSDDRDISSKSLLHL